MFNTDFVGARPAASPPGTSKSPQPLGAPPSPRQGAPPLQPHL